MTQCRLYEYKKGGCPDAVDTPSKYATDYISIIYTIRVDYVRRSYRFYFSPKRIKVLETSVVLPE